MPEDLKLLALLERVKKPRRQRTESNLLKRLETAAATLGIRLWRNQVGSYRLADGRWITSGLSVGSSDLIGYRRVIVTQDMVGKPVAIFTAIEAKSATGRATPQQQAFIARVQQDGGIAAIVRSVQELDATMKNPLH